MKPFRLILFILFALLTLTLTACGGGVGMATSWAGVTTNPDGQTAYVAFNNHVYGVNLSDGAERWRFPDRADNAVSYFAAPALLGSDAIVVGSYNNILRALNVNGSGGVSERWAFTGASNRYVAAPLVEDGMIYAPNADRYLYALNEAGNLLWRYQANEALWSTPVKNGNVIYQSSMGHHVYALDAGAGSLIWESPNLGGAIVSSPTLGEDGRLYVGTFNSELVSLDASTGEIVWRYPTESWVWSGPALDNGSLFFGDLNGQIHAVSASSGERLWRISPEGSGPDASITERPLLVDGTLYLTSENGILYAMDPQNGSTRWTREVGGKLYGAPVLANDMILVAPVGGNDVLVAYDMNGNRRWVFTPAR
jgi:eukaryotic-like serine/threonine-protein kinase